MSRGITRRDWLKLVGGTAAGLMLTPIPWKLLDETAKWSQNWSWTPVPRNGKTNFRYTTCSLCPMSCGVRVRCIDDRPVSVMGVEKHPISGGGLCAFGLGGHLFPYHPLRIWQPCKVLKGGEKVKLVPISFHDSVSAIAQAIASSPKGTVAIMDGRPGRSISYAYRNFLKRFRDGVYIVSSTDSAILTGIEKKVLNVEKGTFGYDISAARTIISFGAPLLDGWGTLSQFSSIVKRRTGSQKLNLIQVEAAHSRTASLADDWLPVKPGMEAAIALAIANVLISEGLCDTEKLRINSTDFDGLSGKSFRNLLDEFSPAKVSKQADIPQDKIISVARQLASEQPSLAISSGGLTSSFSESEQIIFADLNIILGAVGRKGGLVHRSQIPSPIDGDFVNELHLNDVADHSIKVLILDGTESGGTIPWRLVQKKLITGSSLVVSLSPYFYGFARYADYVIPSPTYLESYDDSPTPWYASTASYAISVPVLPAPAGVTEPLEVLKGIVSWGNLFHRDWTESLNSQMLLRNRVDRIFKSAKGSVFHPSKGQSTRLADLPSSKQFMGILSNGGCWYDERNEIAERSIFRYSFFGGKKDLCEQLLNFDNGSATGDGLVLIPQITGKSPSHQLMTKIYRESNLLPASNIALVNSETGKKFNLVNGGEAIVKTELGELRVKVKFDNAVMDGVVQVTFGPSVSFITPEMTGNNVLEICKTNSDLSWQITKAEIYPA
jgi:anaerobic selenocysteine-containing dehydrogenase